MTSLSPPLSFDSANGRGHHSGVPACLSLPERPCGRIGEDRPTLAASWGMPRLGQVHVVHSIQLTAPPPSRKRAPSLAASRR